MRATRLSLVLLFALLTLPGCPKTGTSGPAGVVGGTVELDYQYPWVVGLRSSCRGVLIHPQWVLTAAHCILPVQGSFDVFYRRTDPYTGDPHGEDRAAGLPPNGATKHPQHNVPSVGDNDIALIKLAQPFEVTQYIQTVALPSTPIAAGLVGTVASSFSHNMMLPPGQVAVFRAPVPPLGFGLAFVINTTDATGSLCEGDSGSGFVTQENGRATVRGILSEASGDCVTPANHLTRFIDVFQYRDWILKTIRMSDAFLEGNTRVRWSGRAARGLIGLGCLHPFGTMWGPLEVVGVEEGANCEAAQTQSVVCSLNAAGAGPAAKAITGFTMKTECAPLPTTVQSLPFTPTFAGFFGLAPVHPDPLGICRREFNCRIGLADVAEPGEAIGFAP